MAATLNSWLTEPMKPAVAAAIDKLRRADDIQHIAVMPDVHLATGVCIGTVMATQQLLYPAAIGGDVGCGMMAVRFDCTAEQFRRPELAQSMLAKLKETIPITHHRKRNMPPLPSDLPALSHDSLQRCAERDGRIAFGTLGRGNHFLEFQADDRDHLWVMVHSGSRAMGQAIFNLHMKHGTKTRHGFVYLSADSAEGKAYLNDVQWASAYAAANRRHIIADAADAIVGGVVEPETEIHCDHNHLRTERHFGEEYWVHRKGANAAHVDEPGIIPGSMGTLSYHVLGRGREDALKSSSHGAGRAMSRHEARRRISGKQTRQELRHLQYDETLSNKLCEETPSAYKNIDAVMRAQKELVKITRTLRPVLSYKGV